MSIRRVLCLTAVAGIWLSAISIPSAGAAPADPEETGRTVAATVTKLGGIDYGYERDTGTYVVRLPAGASNVAAVQTALAPLGAPMRVVTSTMTAATITNIQNSIVSLSRSTTGKGYFYGSGYDALTDKVRLSSNATGAGLDSLLKTYAAGLDYRKVATGGRVSRTNDGQPHHGGASLKDGAVTAYCSSGFTVKRSNGSRAMVTAGHCWNGTSGTAIFDQSGANLFGSLLGRTGYPNYDQDLITSSTYSRDIYTGGAAGVLIPVISADDPAVSGSYCHSGRTTYEHCGLNPFTLNGQFCDDDGCTNSLVAYTGTDLQGGDSGAPFYAKTTAPAAKIRGMAIAQAGPDSFAERWLRIASHLNVTIVTTVT